MSCLITAHEMGTVIIPTLRMRKQRHIVVKPLFQVTGQVGGGTGFRNLGGLRKGHLSICAWEEVLSQWSILTTPQEKSPCLWALPTRSLGAQGGNGDELGHHCKSHPASGKHQRAAGGGPSSNLWAATNSLCDLGQATSSL